MLQFGGIKGSGAVVGAAVGVAVGAAYIKDDKDDKDKNVKKSDTIFILYLYYKLNL
jgi:hypothetical protein